MRPRAVVAGGAGFIGFHFVSRLLNEGFDVVIVDNLATGTHRNVTDLLAGNRCEFVEHDVCQPLVVSGPVDYLVNLACPASPADFSRIPVEIMRSCSEGTYNLLEIALHKRAQFLHASTSEIYGDPEIHPQSEDYTGNVNIAGPRAVYDEGKRYAETLIHTYHRQFDMPVHIARIFNTYGPRMRPDDGRAVSNFCVQALTGQPLTIYGNGQQTRCFCYVEDLVDGLFRLMTSEHTGPFNMGSSQEISVQELAEKAIKLAGSSSQIEYLPLLHPDDPKRRRPALERIQKALGFAPTTNLDTGLQATLDWFQQVITPERA